MKKKKVLIISFLLFLGLLNGKLRAQNIEVSVTSISKERKGSDLLLENYRISQDAAVTFENGSWVAVKLQLPKNFAKKDHFIHLSYALLDTVELWIPNETNTLELAFQTGQAFNFSSRPYSSSDFVFPVTEGTTDYYFRIYSSKPVVLPFQVIPEKGLFKKINDKDFLFGMYAGIILVMFLYNAVLLFITKDKSYAFYILYLLALVITQLALFGYTDRFLLPNWPELNQKFAALSGALVAIVSVFFVINFLQLRKKAPLYGKLMLLVILLDSLGIFFLAMSWDVLAFHWVNITSLYGSIVGIIAGIKLSLEGFKPAKFFLIAWSLFLISVIIFALVNLGVIPYNPYFHGAMLFGSSVEAVLLSVALADRITILRKEKEVSQEKAYELARKNEQIIREQNVLLEEQVTLRTRELNQSNDQLNLTLENLKATQKQLIQSEKMASLGILTAGIAHEINNPLNYIDGGYKAINNKIKEKNTQLEPKDIKEYLRWIKIGVERATKIIKNLNAYSRSEENYIENCNLNEIIENCLKINHKKIEQSIELRTTLDKKDVILKCNSSRLQQAILNLLDNAIDAVENNGFIQISSEIKNNTALLSISDNGCGISEKDLAKILDPFYTTKDPDKGTGLGLSIVHTIVQEHGGSIAFDSEIGKGTTVSIHLPIF